MEQESSKLLHFLLSHLDLILFLVLLTSTYFIGRWIEKRHYEEIRRRERALMHLPAITFMPPLGSRSIESSTLVYGSVVVSLDYFKRFLAGLRALVGGRIKSFEPLLDRGRREAVLRMKEAAAAGGFQVIVNVRYDTSRIASAGKQGRGTAGVEVIVYGTAVKPAS